MPRSCTVCTHAERATIDRALVAGEACRTIADRFGLSKSATLRHKEGHIAATLAAAERRQETHGDGLLAQATEQKDTADAYGIDLRQELGRCFERVNLLFDACDAWLRDPADPTRYDLGPRSEEVQVIYEEVAPDGRPTRAKASLADLLARLRVEGVRTESVETKHAVDPRELILKTANRLQSQLELVARLVGELDQRPTVNLTISAEWLTVRSALLVALGPYPEARIAVAEKLALLETSNGHRA